jgi:hypothetical protein
VRHIILRMKQVSTKQIKALEACGFRVSIQILVAAAVVVPRCSATVQQFFSEQVRYEQATSLDDRENIAAEIESQYDCELKY